MECIWILQFFAYTVAHMYMSVPAPRGYKGLTGIQNNQIDYDIASPTTQPCQGKSPGAPVQTIRAGQVLNVEISGEASHGGGHCQFAVSYDGKTYVVLKTITDSCPQRGPVNYSIDVPRDIPSSQHAIFAWTWINRQGNREYYWNCADVKIQGAIDGKLSGPELLIVNIMGKETVPEWTSRGDEVGTKLLTLRKVIAVSPKSSPEVLPEHPLEVPSKEPSREFPKEPSGEPQKGRRHERPSLIASAQRNSLTTVLLCFTLLPII